MNVGIWSRGVPGTGAPQLVLTLNKNVNFSLYNMPR